MAKITKTYSVDQKLYEAFEQVADEKNINKSSFIEGCINKYLNENNIGHDKVFILKTNPSYSVTIKRQDDTFYYLNDGSKIPIILFMQMYKEVEQLNPGEFSTREDRNEINNYLSKTGFEGLDRINS